MLFTLMTVALALAAWTTGETARAVRRHFSPWKQVGPTAATTWASLRRWARRAVDGTLFGFPTQLEASLRERTGRMMLVLADRGAGAYREALGGLVR